MDYKKIKTSTVATTRNLKDFSTQTDNVYESLVVIAKRSNQIAADLKDELNHKIEDFSTKTTDAVSDEIFENKEQIELARYYEQIPKPTLIAIQEFVNKDVYYKYPNKD